MTLYRERDYYHCEHCGAYHFPNPNPEGMRVLGENPEGYQCPLCGITFNMVTVDDFYRGYQCRNCRGLMFNRETFRETIETRRAKAKTPPEPVSRFDPTELERTVYCPICEKQMGRIDTWVLEALSSTPAIPVI
jgi:Zn-finger nucleic acid-binding protein